MAGNKLHTCKGNCTTSLAHMGLDGLEWMCIERLDTDRYSSDDFGIANASVDNETGPIILVRQRL